MSCLISWKNNYLQYLLYFSEPIPATISAEGQVFLLIPGELTEPAVHETMDFTTSDL